MASGGASLVLPILLLIGCANLEKVGLGENVFDQIAIRDLSAKFPEPPPAPQPEGPTPTAQVYPGASSATPPGTPATAAGSVESGAAQNGEGFDLNFQDAQVGDVAKVVLNDLLGITYLLDPRVQGTITLSSARPVAKKDLLPLFESALKLVSGTLVREGGVYRIVPAGEAVGSGPTDNIERGRFEPGYGISVLPLRHVSAQTVLRALDSFAAKPGTVRVDQGRNLLLVQGSGVERASTIETALALDVDWMRNQSVGIFPVRNASPETIIAELQNVFDSGREGTAANLVRFQPVSRLNAVLAVAQTSSALAQVQTWVSRLDKADYSGTTIRVYRVRFGNARIMAGILREVFTGQGGGQIGLPGSADLSQLTPGSAMQRAQAIGTPMGGQQVPPRPGTGAGTDSPTSTQDPQSAATRPMIGAVSGSPTDQLSQPSGPTGPTGPPLLPNVRITADIANNSLLIYANRDQYRIIERAIFELDRAPLQVAIDATVAEITLKNELQYGVQFFLQDRDGRNQGSIGFGATAALRRTLPGFNLVLGPADDPRMVLDALRKVTDVKVLSSPALVVLDNQQAMLQVGDEVPIATRSAQGVEVPNAPIINNIEMRNTGVILRVTPRVNANGVVTLDVIQEISNVASTVPTLTPTISQRRVQSSIAVASGQTVLLGGLISSRNERGKSGIPILSELPRVGDLFGSNTGSETRTELIIFIRPQIIRDGVDAQAMAEELRAKLSVLGRGPARSTIITPNTRAPAVRR